MNVGKRLFFVWAAIALLFIGSIANAQDSLFAPAVNLYIDYGMADVVAADLDNDGCNDLAVADNDSYIIGIYENDGFGNFSHVATYGVGANPGWIVAKDLNADGKLDIAISNDFTHDVTVFWGNGDCTFQNAFSLYTDGRNGEVIAFDIDNDSDIDLMAPVFSRNHIAYFINNGNGTFQNVQYIPTSGSPFAIYSNDFDSDSDEDIAFTALSYLCVMLNDGAGNFSSAGTIPMCSGTYSNTGGDVDNDGDIDIISVNTDCNQIQLFLNNGNAVFSPGSAYSTGSRPLDAELADLNNDGNLDIVTVNKCQDLANGSCSVFLGMGNGAFTPENTYPTGQWPGAVCIADLNGDQNLDFAAANFGAGTISIYENIMARIIYVAIDGNDSTGTGTITNPFRTIQHAINTAVNGDTVLATDGHYYERISFMGKAIIVTSNLLIDHDTLHISNTIIDADTAVLGVSDTGSVVRFVNGETPTSILYGFTITKGTIQGGFLLSNTYPLIKNCIVTNNSRGAYIRGAVFSLDSCKIDSGQTVSVPDTSSCGSLLWIYRSILKNTNIIFTENSGMINISDSKIYSSEIQAWRSIGMSRDSLFDSRTGVDGYGPAGEGNLSIQYSALMRSEINMGDGGASIYQSYVEGEIYGGGTHGTTINVSHSVLKNGIGNSVRTPRFVSLYNSLLFNGSIYFSDRASMNNTIIMTSDQPCLISNGAEPQLYISCSDIYGFGDSAWLSGPLSVLDTSNLYFQNPLFCDTANDNYGLLNTSICLPSNNACNALIGLYDQGCELSLYPFSLIFPPNQSVIPDTPLFVWSNCIDNYYGTSATYKFYFDDNPDFISPESSEIISDTNYFIAGGLAHSAQYYWKVLALFPKAPSKWCNESFSFYFDGYPTTPAILDPHIGELVDSLTYITWLVGTDPDSFDMVSYEIQFDEDSLFGTPKINDTIPPGIILNNSVSVRIKQLQGYLSLQNDQIYYWRVRSLDNYGLTSPWPDTLHWVVYNHLNHPPLPPASGFSPANSEEVISLTPTITWNNAVDPDPDDNPGTLHYILRLFSDTSTGCGYEYWDTTADGINQAIVADTMPDNCLWIYMVQTVDNEGLASGWSPMLRFWTNHYNYPPEPFPLNSPADDIRYVAAHIKFNWSRTVDYDPLASFRYAFQYSPDSLFATGIRTVYGLTDTSLTLLTDTLAAFGDNLYWRILAIDDDSLIRVGGIPEQTRKLTIFPPGDANGDHSVLGGDVTYLVRYFKGLGNPPDPFFAGDANGDCSVLGGDVTFLVRYFKGLGSAPARANCEEPGIILKTASQN